jgi:nitric oxide reductase NorD protein
MHLLDLMEPEETVGNIWHDFASQLSPPEGYANQAVALKDVRPSLALLFRALEGGDGVEISESSATPSLHRISVKRKLGTARETMHRASFDGEHLYLPPVMDCFPTRDLNKMAYLWLAALAAVIKVARCPSDPLQSDLFQVSAMSDATISVLSKCPGMHKAYYALREHILDTRKRPLLPRYELDVERQVRCVLKGEVCGTIDPTISAPMGYSPSMPVSIWLSLTAPNETSSDHREDEETSSLPIDASKTRKTGSRKDRNEANRKDSFIIHRFESILSWVESMNLNRSVDDDDDENAQKAADDQDEISLSRHDKKAATRLRLHLDLSPEDADHERISGEFTYPEWNHRTRSYMPDHCSVLEAEAHTNNAHPLIPDPRLLREVRRQFEALQPRRILRPRQIEGSELDLEAAIAAQINLRATGQDDDRIYQSLRQTDRDLSVAFLMDTSRSTEASLGETNVIDVAREALAALAGGIDASGDRLGIWGFSSLKRDRVFLKRCKSFDAPFAPDVINRICCLSPCHYTRLGAAIRHTSELLSKEPSARKLLLVLTDGKPNDLDHYEGIHGIEDSHMAVREARRTGQTVHGIVVDRDGQDWFTRIFGRGGFTLLPNPSRLTRALPQIYRSLVQEN